MKKLQVRAWWIAIMAIIILVLVAGLMYFRLVPIEVCSVTVTEHPSVGLFREVVGVSVLSEERVYEDLEDYVKLGSQVKKKITFEAGPCAQAVQVKTFYRGNEIEVSKASVEPGERPEIKSQGLWIPGSDWGDLPSSYTVPHPGEVEDQGNCGSCWAFASSHSTDDNLVGNPDLSEKWILDCNTFDYGCDGGFWVHDDFLNYVVRETDAPPYVPYEEPCQQYPTSDGITGWKRVDNTPGAIKQAIYDHGKVAVALCVNNAFGNWNSDEVFEKEYGCGIYEPANHGVTLVGWDDNKGHVGAFLLKNSWGPGWNGDGYIWISYDIVLTQPVAVTDEPMPPPAPITTATVTIDSMSVQPGDTFITAVSVEDLAPSVAYQMVIHYNEGVIQPVVDQFVFGEMFNEPDVIDLGPSLNAGHFAFGRLDINRDEYSGSGYLGYIAWKAVGEGESILHLATTGDPQPHSYFLDRDNERPPQVLVDGLVTVTTDPTPTPTPTEIPPTPTYVPPTGSRIYIPFASEADAREWLDKFGEADIE